MASSSGTVRGRGSEKSLHKVSSGGSTRPTRSSKYSDRDRRRHARANFAARLGRASHLAEVLRLKGWMLSLKGDLEGAEGNFLASLDWARRQQAKSWELRTSTSLARLWQSQGKRQDAYELLAPVYDWFTEGFDTKDLQEAKSLLDELAERPADAVLSSITATGQSSPERPNPPVR